MEQKKSSSSRWWKKCLWILLIFIGSLFVSSVVVTAFFGDRLAGAVLDRLYRSLETEVSHEKVSLSLWRGFPNLTVDVQGLDVEAAGRDDTLGRIQLVSLKINLLDIIRGKYCVRKADVKEVSLYLHTYADSTHNWDVFKPSEDTSEKDFYLQLSSVRLSDVDIRFRDEVSSVNLKGKVHRLKLKGDIARDSFSLDFATSVWVDHLDVDTSFHWESKNMKGKGLVNVDLRNQCYVFHQCALSLNEESVVVDGCLFLERPEVWAYEAELQGKAVDVSDVMKELPPVLVSSLNAYRFDGLLDVHAHAKGCMGAENRLALKSEFSVRKAGCGLKGQKNGLSQMSFNGTYDAETPDISASSVLKINDLYAKLQSGQIRASAQMDNFQALHVRASVDAGIRLEDLTSLLPALSSSRMQGDAVAKVFFEHHFPEKKENGILLLHDATLNGSLQIGDACFQYDSASFLLEKVSAKLAFSGQDAVISHFSGNVQGNACKMSAKVGQVLDFISGGDRLKIVAEVSSPSIDIGSFVGKEAPSTAQKTMQSPSPVSIPAFLDADVRFSADHLKYDRFEADKVKGRIWAKNASLKVRDFSMKTLDGTTDLLHAEVLPMRKGGYILSAEALTHKVDIQRLFYVMHDFGQSPGENSLTHQNIGGKVDAHIQFSAETDPYLNLSEESIDCKAALVVKEGKLQNYKPLEKLSAFVKLDELKNIRFDTMKDTVSIRHGVIGIPNMEIRNSLLNMWLSGTQSFAGDLHYDISLRLSDVLARKRKNRVFADDFGEVMDDGSKGVMLYLLVSGNTDKVNFGWNKSKAKEARKENFRNQREELNSVFSSNKKKEETQSVSVQSSTAVPKKQKEREELNNSQQKHSELDLEDW